MGLHQTEQHAKYVAVRDKLFNPPKSKADPKPLSLTTGEDIRKLKDAYELAIDNLNKQLKTVTLSAKYEIEKAKLEGASTISRLELDLADARARILTQAEMLRSIDIDAEPTDNRRSVKEIVSEVLERYPGVTWEDVKSIRRTRELIEPRHECMRAVYEERKDLSTPRIGQLFQRDHTVILYAARKLGEAPRKSEK